MNEAEAEIREKPNMLAELRTQQHVLTYQEQGSRQSSRKAVFLMNKNIDFWTIIIVGVALLLLLLGK